MPAKRLFTLPVMTLIMVLAICTAMVVWEISREHRYDPLIVEATEHSTIDPLLVRAIIKKESNFKPTARGGKGEIGLMQVTPVVGREYAAKKGWKSFQPESLYDPRLNIEVGCWYLRKAMRRYSSAPDQVQLALAHYNAGASNVDRWLAAAEVGGGDFVGNITYPTTKEYVRYVMRRWRWYRLLSSIGL